MNKSNKVLLQALMVVFACGVSNVVTAKELPGENKATPVAQTEGQVARSVKPLTVSGTEALKAVFDQEEWIVRQIFKAYKNILIAQKGLKTFATWPPARQKRLGAAVTKKLRRVVIGPIQGFLKILRDFSWMFGGVVEQALVNGGKVFPSSFLGRFLVMDKSKVATVVEDNVNSVEELKGLCEELAILYLAFDTTFPEPFAKVRKKM